ncbi:trithorax group protein osa-like [Mercenaria mercenaria]|uniref:trithorax group protein osa-like n=1 Tax=Mercenaria mercenaria TaxID=6596 RepID=UPI00234EB230|nr:trithorax group protein osa-like [Mercenaria mercenaria]
MMLLQIISLMLLVRTANSQGNLFDMFGFGTGMGGAADPFGTFDPFLGAGGGLGGGMGSSFGSAAAPLAPTGPDPAAQNARLTMAEEQMAEVMGESPTNSPERQRIDRLIKESGGQFTGDAAPLNYLVQDYLMTTPGSVPPPQPKQRPAGGANAGMRRQGRRRNRNRQGRRQNVGNRPNRNGNIRNGPASPNRRPPSPNPTRPTGRIGKQTTYPPRPRKTARPMNQGRAFQSKPPPNNRMYQGQPMNNQMHQGQPPNNQIYQGQAPPINNMYQGQPPPNNQNYQNLPPQNSQNYQGQPPRNQMYQGQPSQNNNMYQGQPPSNQGQPSKSNQIYQGQSTINNQGYKGQTKSSMYQASQPVKRRNFQGNAPTGQTQGNYQATQGPNKNNKIQPAKSRQGGPIAADRLKRIQGRINTINGQLLQARQNNNMAQVTDLQAQLEALNGVKHILTGGSSKTNNNQVKTIRGLSKTKQLQMPPPSQAPPQNNVPYGPPKINRNNRNNLNNGPYNNNFQETNIGGGKFAQTWRAETPVPTNPQQNYQPVPPNPQQNYQPVPPNPRQNYQPVPLNPQQNYQPVPPNPQQNYQPVPPNSQRNYQPVPPNPQQNYQPVPPTPQQNYQPVPPTPQQNYQPVPPNPQQNYQPVPPNPQQNYQPVPPNPQQNYQPVPPNPRQYPYQAAGNGNAYNQRNSGFNKGNPNRQWPQANVNIQPYQNAGPTADPYAPYDQGINQQTAPFDAYVLPYDQVYNHGLNQQQPVYDPYAQTYDQGMNVQGGAANTAPAPRRRQGRRKGGAKPAAAPPPPTPAPTGTTAAPVLGDIKLIRGEEYIYTDADGYDTFQWIKKSTIPASQLDHLPQKQAGQEQQQGQQAAATEGAAAEAAAAEAAAAA